MSEVQMDAKDAPKDFMGHPRGLMICFLTEMWERFSYYGMRALLIFYLTKHFLFTDGQSASIYAAYISMVYITPVVGGIIADKYLGAGKAVMLGAVLLVLGHAGMAIEGVPATETIVDGVANVVRDGDVLQTFYMSLALIIMGVGFLKPNISTIVGSLYERNDPRRDSGFTLFYMGINLGSFLSALVCGYLGETYGWNWGFGSAGIGMLLGLVVFAKGKHLFNGTDLPANPEILEDRFFGIKREHLIYIGSLGGVLICWQLMQHQKLVGGLLGFTGVAMVGTILYYAFTKLDKIDRDRMLVCAFLMMYQIIFWGLFEQTGSSLSLMIDRNVDRVFLGWEMKASMFQSINAFFIFALAPLFGLLWVWLSKKGWEPSTPMKFALCLFQVGLGFLVMVYGASIAPNPSEVAVIWVILLFLLHTTGELCMSPVGLSMTTKLSVPKVVGMMMGVWFLCSAAGNFVSGLIAKAAGAETVGGVVVDKAAALAGYMEVYQTVGYFAIGAGIFAVLVTPVCKKMMHGIH